MIRVVSGSLKGRKLRAPQTEATRPVSDRAKEAFFGMLGDISGMTFLDAYSGSGSMAFEAISRGASYAVGVDSGREASEVFNANVATLGIEGSTEMKVRPLIVWLSEDHREFDIVFADPPFPDTDQAPLQLLAHRSRRVFAYKHSRRHTPVDIAEFTLRKSRRYGDSMISVYTRSE